ncbi:MAG TPA: hypothetical protein VGL77_17020, partial [Armatimonadota bacterium]
MGIRTTIKLGLLGILGVLGACGAGWGEAAIVPYHVGPSTRMVAQSAILENDLVFQAGDAQYRTGQYPQAAVVRWEPISGDQPGRYRVSLRARTAAWGESSLVLQAWTPVEAGGTVMPTNYGPIPVTQSARSLNGYAFTKPGEWQNFTLDFNVEKGQTISVGLMYVGKDTCPSGKIQVEASSLSLEKLAMPVSMSWARPTKVRYHHNDQGALEYRITNSTTQLQSIAVRPVIMTDTGVCAQGKSKPVQVPPLATISGTVPFAVPAADGGYEARCELLQGDTCIDRRGDVFAVSDNPYRCLIAGPGPYPIPSLLPSAFLL